MTRSKLQTVLYRRKRQFKTDYNKRLKLLTSRKLRMAVRFSNRKTIGQIIEFSPKGDVVKAAVSSDFLRKQGWKYSTKNLPSAYLTGYWLGKKALAVGINEAILDSGFKKPFNQGKIYAFLKGALDAGLNVAHGGKEIFPGNDRIEGQHLKNNVKEIFAVIKKTLDGN